MNVVHLEFTDIALASLLALASAVASIALRLNVHRQVLWAAGRMVVQLLLVGLVLRLVFASQSAGATLLVALVMVAAASREVAVRPEWRIAGGGNHVIASITVALASAATVVLALLTAIRPQPWHDPRYAIPLLGIVLGSVLNSTSLGLDSFLEGVALRRGAIEAQLALGSSIQQALSELIRSSIRRGFIPMINQMSAAGIITLPGIMTGQLLAGMDPMEAAKYQILLLLLLTGAGGMASIGAILLAVRWVSDDRQRLRMDRLQRTRSAGAAR
ncbi:MAG: ABC transporter permease [Proteobacteria bacterium]|nr:ABC transporter permease [Pseudomonadota bacterium]